MIHIPFRLLKKLKPYKLSNNIYIITYHGIVEQKNEPYWERNFTLLKDFREHLNFFSKYRILTTEELLYYIEQNTTPQKPSFYLTFDDGYRNNQIAAELFNQNNMFWCLFVSTQNITTGDYIWTIDLALLFRFTQKTNVLFDGKTYELGSEEKLIQSFNTIRKQLKNLAFEERQKQIIYLQTQLELPEIEPLRKKMPSFEMLNWNEVIELSAFSEIGSHGVNHELLHANQTGQTILFELTESKNQIETRLNKPCNLFAYPNGDYCQESVIGTLSTGYKLAFTTKQAYAKPPYERMLLPRTDAVVNVQKLKNILNAKQLK